MDIPNGLRTWLPTHGGATRAAVEERDLAAPRRWRSRRLGARLLPALPGWIGAEAPPRALGSPAS